MQVVISTQDLSKTYKTGFWKTKQVVALDRLNLQVHDNEIFGCLGPNGAGKSTTLKLLMSLIYPTSGKAEILGESVANVASRRQIGYLPENPYFYEYLTAEEFLAYYAGLFGCPPLQAKDRVTRLLKLTGIFPARKLQLRKYSKGMIQRLGIAQAIVNDPRIVFLDEPMSGLDPVGRRDVRDLILHLKREGKTVFFSTHILNDVETICDRVAVLNRGRLVGSGLLNELFQRETTHLEMSVSGLDESELRRLLDPDMQVSQSGITCIVELAADAELGPIITRIERASGKVLAVSPVRQTMEDYFFRLVGDNQRSREVPLTESEVGRVR
jgi:ABC-2 type transport system ATP-binding protein